MNMVGKFAIWTGLLVGSFCLSVLLAVIFPSLPARFVYPGLPFRYVVTLADTVAMVEQVDEVGDWSVLDSAWSKVNASDCHCPDLMQAHDLSALQRYSNLEHITLQAAGTGQYLLQASRDDLGGPQVGYLYACDSLGMQHLLRYDSFFGISYPVLGWKYLLGMSGGLMVLGVLLVRPSRRATGTAAAH